MLQWRLTLRNKVLLVHNFGTAFVSRQVICKRYQLPESSKPIFWPRETTQDNSQHSAPNNLNQRQCNSQSQFTLVVALDVGPVNQAGTLRRMRGHVQIPSGQLVDSNVGEEWTPGSEYSACCRHAGPETGNLPQKQKSFCIRNTKNDSGITLHASANPQQALKVVMKLGDIKGEFLLTQPLICPAGSGGSTSKHEK